MRRIQWLLLVAAAAATPTTGARSQQTAKPEEAITTEVRGFYRDLRAQRTAALLDHFWPSKITARWEPPIGERKWTDLGARRRILAGSAPASPCIAGTDPPLTAELAIVGRWARVLATPCPARATAGADELWLLEVNGKWKIVRLILEPRNATEQVRSEARAKSPNGSSG
jgi:hypothetical protein